MTHLRCKTVFTVAADIQIALDIVICTFVAADRIHRVPSNVGLHIVYELLSERIVTQFPGSVVEFF